MRLVLLIAALATCWWLAPTWWPLWLLGIAFSPGCVCCNTCTIVSDDFSSNDISTNWTVDTSGSWNITGGALTASTTSARLINNTAHPVGGFMRVSATITPTSGDIYRLYAAYKDSTHYVAMQIEFGTPSAGSVFTTYRLIQNGSTINTQTETISASTAYVFALCIAVDGLSASGYRGGALIGLQKALSAFTSGQVYAGVGTGSTAGAISFDNFLVERTDNSCPACGLYCIYCDTNGFGPEYLVTISGVTNGSSGCSGCSAYNGAFVMGTCSTFGATSCAAYYNGASLDPCNPSPKLDGCAVPGAIASGGFVLNFSGATSSTFGIEVNMFYGDYNFQTNLIYSAPYDCTGGGPWTIPASIGGFHNLAVCQIDSASCTVTRI